MVRLAILSLSLIIVYPRCFIKRATLNSIKHNTISGTVYIYYDFLILTEWGDLNLTKILSMLKCGNAVLCDLDCWEWGECVFNSVNQYFLVAHKVSLVLKDIF